MSGAQGFVPVVPLELLALPLVDAESSAAEWARQEPLNGYGVVDDDRISAAAAMEARRLAEEIAAKVAAQLVAEDAPILKEESRGEMLPPPLTVEAQRMAAAAREVTQAVSVAAAYFEDTLHSAPGVVLAAGTLGAEALGRLLREAGFREEEIKVREMIEPAMLTGGAVSTRVPRGWMAGVRGALRS